ncbi:mitogen-activated protein kinase kinase kinase 18-like [Macadamia integrifolia]|uniref:mitogen-activated protein kinase kinase kinase 18-like n=1 Tax=Macadamia integrifolia TaxID=60698 RepID=UPI001C528312|nr:mitogen-activated protein kinase kinase kinase 18-like [Macadamia integrifolia]
MEWTRGRTIGRGSFATVSLAKTHRSGEVFAVKSVDLSRSEFLQREQRVLSLIDCPRIVGYVGCDVTHENGRLMYNLFMEYISGGTLTDVIQDHGGRLDESEIRSHTRAILMGLDYLHSRRLVHCDIKGRNVLIGADGAKIADLGCTRWVDEEAPAMPIAGTPVFMAPEVARGDEQSFPADVWALGCTVIEMATGRPPWPDIADPVSALHRIAFSSDIPDFPTFLSEEAKHFLGKCLKRDPKERWTADQLLKHPFLDQDSKQIQGSTSSISPTSILDQGFWDSLEESDTETPLHISNLLVLSSSNSPAERIRRLVGDIPSSSSTPNLPDWTKDRNWVTVRSNNHAEITGSSDEVELESFGRSSSVINGSEHLVHYNSNSSSISSNSLRRFSVSSNDVNAFSVSSNPNYELARGKEFLLSSIPIPLL